MFTQIDKIAKLQRLVKQIDEWNCQKDIQSYGPIFRIGKSPLSIDSPEFKEWRDKVTATVVLIFGEHSHYVDEFADISYTDIFAMFSRLSGGPETRLWAGLAEAKSLLQTMIDEIKATDGGLSFAAIKTLEKTRTVKRCVFIGHGGNPLWLAVTRVLNEEWGLQTVYFESEPRTSESIVPILTEMLERASFAVIVLTAEDVTATGEARGRQNVIHEAGLSQGKLGFEKVVILKQEGVVEPSNLAGLQFISFLENRIQKAFYELQCVLKREGLIS
jgi:predicted nucleotide-binding protein